MTKIDSAVSRNIIPRVEEIQKIVMEVLKNKDITLSSFKVIESMILDDVPPNTSLEMLAVYYAGYMNGCKATILEASKDLKTLKEDLSFKDAYKADNSIN